ncbi:MAG: type II toxin-antitoxin system HipA family toxin, partial [Alphaproteobacteria bacterium]|nr:type II toxin-antitoxin system HipA family toxin [Alphaproteobacteria bacterium]
MTRALDVYLDDVIVGSLQQSDDGALMFGYRADYLGRNDKRAISVSMPLREEPYPDRVARPYFSGLLPDERARQRLAAALGVSDGNAFGLLEVIGGECAGALSLLPQGAVLPDAGTQPPEILTQERLVDVLELLRTRPLLGGEEGIRLSLAGAQDKLAVCVVGGDIALAKDGRPTTHILKPFIAGLDGSVENELFCMLLAGRLGLSVAEVDRGKAGATDFLLVRRYDRHSDKSGAIKRLHQEDFCQALSVPPELKYEDEGGPGIAQSLALLADHARRPAADRLAFQKMLIFHYLVGNADAHAKNYALLYGNKAPDLAPLYDVVCTAAYPRLAKKLAMKIGGRAIADTI